jgi:predicted transcriptional regulator
MINVSVPDELAQLVADLSEDSRRSLDELLREAIEDYLWEQKHGEAVLQRLADLDAGRTQAIPLSQVMADYGLDD